ncbi:DNA-binding protein with PD1-like DNA-binding motif [Salipiger aestuarii]|uniref:PPC domain-containing protein n=1 Tax=Salipiger aestuarii TaxID=568098 RepID=A0A327YN26_9RHOB|nr:PPC domain-containing DNA-binding protein [Salipiger aestuarii]EIE49283.1 hypothetical protein C357_19673 [Citreicella sp. 357]KAA8608847.1 DNA-binding protein with PD1-like DNA-binding motif [Salipiger aestuarii]KAA8613152.1 DNA-binding protein with PD1-like DNA-binding motif [Salipiger aestuarii]KAB2542992.1 DNA-binding protein with PD1-like DNA-binding motif [Salipiger aestuarii]RAK19629.1 hypothetical protein ATI53_100811 [Salipiger aestuarii]
MRYKLLEDIGGRRKFVLALDAGENAIESITAFAQDHDLGATSLTGIGAFAQASLGYFNPATKEFRQNDITDQTEVLSMIGNIAVEADGKHKLHVHVVLGCIDATTRGGHLIEASVRPTLEIVLEESPAHLARGVDAKSGLVLLQP